MSVKIEIYKRPEFRRPVLLAGFPGMGMVAKQTVDYLIRKLNAEFFGEIVEEYPSVNTIIYNEGVFTSFPKGSYKLYFWREGDNELILLSGDQQPILAEKQHEMAEKIVEFSKDISVRRIYTTAAMAVLRYVERPRVYAVVSHPQLLDEIKRFGIEAMPGEGTIRGLNGLLIGYSRLKDVESACLLGETYLVDSMDVLAALAVTKKVSQMLDLDVDLSEMEEIARKVSEETQRALREAKAREERRLGYIS